MPLFSSAYAQDVAASVPPEGSAIASMLPLVLILGIMYFFMIRPQQRRLKQHQMMVSAAGKGDKILTAGGVVGKVVKVDDANDLLHVQIAEGVVVEVSRPTVSVVYGKENAKPAADVKAAASSVKKKPVANDN
jgi:preprotein translocase subunit YajC